MPNIKPPQEEDSQISKDVPTSTDTPQKPITLAEARAVLWFNKRPLVNC
jgi:hypothetical protein